MSAQRPVSFRVSSRDGGWSAYNPPKELLVTSQYSRIVLGGAWNGEDWKKWKKNMSSNKSKAVQPRLILGSNSKSLMKRSCTMATTSCSKSNKSLFTMFAPFTSIRSSKDFLAKQWISSWGLFDESRWHRNLTKERIHEDGCCMLLHILRKMKLSNCSRTLAKQRKPWESMRSCQACCYTTACKIKIRKSQQCNDVQYSSTRYSCIFWLWNFPTKAVNRSWAGSSSFLKTQLGLLICARV